MKTKNDSKKNIIDSLPVLFPQSDALTKLRIMVGLVVMFATLAIILVFFVDFFYSALSILLSYFIAIKLFVKLLVIKHL
jgi:hypothetical protein